MRLACLAAFLALPFVALPIIAESGDAAAVVQYCGKPVSEQQGISQVTNRVERTLTYDTFILHFEPAADGWAFLSGWHGHLPMTEKMVASRMPCFAQAMAVSRAEQPGGPAAFEDPAIRQQTAVPGADHSTFGIPHLWLIVVLAIVVVILFLLPGSRRRHLRQPAEVETMRYKRKPIMDRFRQRRRPRSGLDV